MTQEDEKDCDVHNVTVIQFHHGHTQDYYLTQK